MTTVRYESYRRVLAVLDELESPELEWDERDKILLDAWLVLSSLVRTGRWRYRAAEQMRRMLESCGPDRVPERVPAFA